MLPSGWLADEMLGRLARYLRFVGMDTAYVRGLDDEAVLHKARAEGRVLLTRDRALAHRAPGSILLTATAIEEQWRSLRARFPAIPDRPSFARCTACNGTLLPFHPAPGQPLPEQLPTTGPGLPLDLYRCSECEHVYWEGSHTDSVRRRLARWAEAEPP